MQNAFHTTAIVLPGNRIELTVPELREGGQVQIVLIPCPQMPNGSPVRPSALDAIKALNGHRLFQSPEEVDRYIDEERNSWE